jgi:RecG-like helicase
MMAKERSTDDDASYTNASMNGVGLFGRTWRRLTESTDDRLIRQSAEDHERRHPDEPVSRIDACTPGEEVTLAGHVATLANRPEGNAPALEIELTDGSGRVFVVWLGRRRIPGIHEGRRLVIHGRLNCVADHPTVYNPRYELLPD